MRIKFYLWSLLFLFATPAAVVYSQTPTPLEPATGDAKPAAAPAFSLISLAGEKFELEALRDKVVVLNFWFIGCKPCVEEFHKLNSLVKKFKNREVVFIAPALDDASALKPFLAKHPFKYAVVPKAGGLILGSYISQTERVAFPTHIVIDRQGRIRLRLEGTKRFAELRETITRLEKEPPAGKK